MALTSSQALYQIMSNGSYTLDRVPKRVVHTPHSVEAARPWQRGRAREEAAQARWGAVCLPACSGPAESGGDWRADRPDSGTTRVWNHPRATFRSIAMHIIRQTDVSAVKYRRIKIELLPGQYRWSPGDLQKHFFLRWLPLVVQSTGD